MRINVSAINLYLECPRKWYYTYVLGRGMPAADALTAGKAFHALIAGEREPDETDPAWMLAGLEAWEEWLTDNAAPVVVAREQPLEQFLPSGDILIGRPDAVVTWAGHTWHLQVKTQARTLSPFLFIKGQARSFHEHAYKFLIEKCYPDLPSYAGTLLVIVRKAVTDTPLIIEPLAVGSPGVFEDMQCVIERMKSHAFPPLFEMLPPQNPNSCTGKWGTRLCDYYNVCEGFVPIETMGQIDPMEGYSP